MLHTEPLKGRIAPGGKALRVRHSDVEQAFWSEAIAQDPNRLASLAKVFQDANQQDEIELLGQIRKAKQRTSCNGIF